MAQHTDGRTEDMGSLPLGIALSLAMAAAFFTFIGLGTFNPAALATPAILGHGWSFGLAYGIGLILASIFTTLLYAVSANAALQKSSR